jgi:hypothetical protein
MANCEVKKPNTNKVQLVAEGMGIGSPDDPKNCKVPAGVCDLGMTGHGGTRESESLSPPRAFLAIFVDRRVALRQGEQKWATGMGIELCPLK